tara:strand:- start:14881 stop:15246 length:366 start_codon:yes stop_codon:yes gene_type:complete
LLAEAPSNHDINVSSVNVAGSVPAPDPDEGAGADEATGLADAAGVSPAPAEDVGEGVGVASTTADAEALGDTTGVAAALETTGFVVVVGVAPLPLLAPQLATGPPGAVYPVGSKPLYTLGM